LWDTPQVQGYLEGVPRGKGKRKRSASQDRIARRQANKRWYEKKKKVIDDIKAKKVNGEIDENEAKRQMGDAGSGWYKYRGKVMKLEDDLKAAEEKGDSAMVKAAEDRLQQILTQATDLMSSVSEDLVKMYANVLPMDQDFKLLPRYQRDEQGRLLHNEEGQPLHEVQRDEDDNPIVDEDGNEQTESADVIHIPTWGTPKDEEFLKILSLILPMGMWVDTAYDKKSINTVRGILMSDKKYSRNNNLGTWVTEREKERILQTFNSAHDYTERFLRAATAEEKENFQRRWIEIREEVRQTFVPKSGSHSPLVFHRILTNCVRFYDDSRDSEDESSEDS